ncbi:hypothetical protein VPHF89G1_0035 [Vibrio phage F89 g1]
MSDINPPICFNHSKSLRTYCIINIGIVSYKATRSSRSGLPRCNLSKAETIPHNPSEG